MAIPRAVLLAREVFGRIRAASTWGDWFRASAPRDSRWTITSWGIAPLHLPEREHRLYVDRLRAAYLVHVHEVLTPGEAIECETFRTRHTPPRHLRLQDLEALEHETCREIVVEAIAGKAFEAIELPPLDLRMVEPLEVVWPVPVVTCRETWRVDRLRPRRT